LQFQCARIGQGVGRLRERMAPNFSGESALGKSQSKQKGNQMYAARARGKIFAALGLFLVASCAFANAQTRTECETIYKPQTGQAGKDVIWVPTNDALVDRMLTMAKTTASDLVYDLGAGDGKIAIAAAKKFGATAVGVEYDADMAKFAQCLVKAEGVSDKAQVIQGDIFETDFSAATVVTLYLLPELNLRLRPTLLKMKPGTRVVSHSFLMDDWEPDDRSTTDDGYAYLWIVPAEVAGTWTFVPQGGGERFVMQLEQTFQNVKGSVGAAANAKPLNGKLNGSQIQLSFTGERGSSELTGMVNGQRIEAVVTDSANKKTRYIGTRS
jgi:SAM-dependent methyltransferase